MDIYNVANQMKLERKTIFDLNIRVTFYARVSTTRDEQENSIENQIAYFTEMIKGNKTGNMSKVMLTESVASPLKIVLSLCR